MEHNAVSFLDYNDETGFDSPVRKHQAMRESFAARLKYGLVRDERFKTRQAASAKPFDYIEVF